MSQKNYSKTGLEVQLPPSEGSEAAPLVITPKLLPPPGENRAPARELRAERYRIQGLARDIYVREGKRQGLKYAFDFHKTAKCRFTSLGRVGVFKSKEHQAAFYGGLVICGRVWTCPVCAAKIQEHRRQEIAKAMNLAYAQGKKCVMITLTFPHMKFDSLQDLLEKQKDALHRLRAGNPYRRIKDRVGYLGMIRSLELTYGENGWHPHTHEVWIVDEDADVEDLKARFVERWRNCCIRAELLDGADANKINQFERHAVDVIDNASSSDYLAKQDDSKNWGADREMAKASTKKGRKTGVHPFRFLVDWDESEGAERQKARKLWLEYTKAMHGKNQILWSRGLKAWAGIDNESDEQLAEKQEDNADALCAIENAGWKLVLRHGSRSQLLDRAELGGRQAIEDYLMALARMIKMELTYGVRSLVGGMREGVIEPDT